MTQTGYWVVGWDGKFGEYKIGRKACTSCNVVVDSAESYDYA